MKVWGLAGDIGEHLTHSKRKTALQALRSNCKWLSALLSRLGDRYSDYPHKRLSGSPITGASVQLGLFAINGPEFAW
eukprot:3347161-Alexandrium_andersonii.AAC.1